MLRVYVAQEISKQIERLNVFNYLWMLLLFNYYVINRTWGKKSKWQFSENLWLATDFMLHKKTHKVYLLLQNKHMWNFSLAIMLSKNTI